MGMRIIVLLLSFGLLLLPIVGCGAAADGRTAEEWLSLAYSGLAAKDQYAFTGSVSMQTADGVAFKPQTFEGKIAQHNQLTMQADKHNQVHFNPIQVLESLREDKAAVELVRGGRRESTVTLQIEQVSEVATKRWRQRLRDELAAVGAAALPEGPSAIRREMSAELERAEQELDMMLSSMQAHSSYELIIDRSSLLPVSIEEITAFDYAYKGRPVTESRRTAVRFQTFNGERGQTVQRLLSHVRM